MAGSNIPSEESNEDIPEPDPPIVQHGQSRTHTSYLKPLTKISLISPALAFVLLVTNGILRQYAPFYSSLNGYDDGIALAILMTAAFAFSALNLYYKIHVLLSMAGNLALGHVIVMQTENFLYRWASPYDWCRPHNHHPTHSSSAQLVAPHLSCETWFTVLDYLTGFSAGFALITSYFLYFLVICQVCGILKLCWERLPTIAVLPSGTLSLEIRFKFLRQDSVQRNDEERLEAEHGPIHL